MWFFSSANVEVLIKVLDGCATVRRQWDAIAASPM
jgi:hypothetical protein